MSFVLYTLGRIYDDGTNNVILHFTSKSGSDAGRNLLGLSYARMDPVRSKSVLPSDEKVKVIGEQFQNFNFNCIHDLSLFSPAFVTSLFNLNF